MPELCFNFWYYLDEQQRIFNLSGRAYYLEGSDEEKGAQLKSLSHHEYRLVASRPPRGGAMHYSEMQRRGIEVVYAEILDAIQASLPKGMRLPEDLLYWATPLFDFGRGFEPAEVGDGFIKNR